MSEHEQKDNPELSNNRKGKLPRVSIETLEYYFSGTEEIMARHELFRKEQPALTDFLAKYIPVTIQDEDSREFAKVNAAIAYILLRHESIEAGRCYKNKSGEPCGLPEVDTPFVKGLEALLTDAKSRQEFVEQSVARFKHLQPLLYKIMWEFISQERSDPSDRFALYMFTCITHEALERWLE